MPVADAILQPYVDAPTLLEAEAELDRLASRGDELPVPLGDLYDELARAADDDDEYGLTARLEAKALEAGCRQRFVAREMRGWYLLKSGAKEESEAVFRELLRERPDDANVRITVGHARSDAGFQDAALEPSTRLSRAPARGGAARRRWLPRLGGRGELRPRQRRGAEHVRRGAKPDGPSDPMAAGSQRPVLVHVGSQVQALLRQRLR